MDLKTLIAKAITQSISKQFNVTEQVIQDLLEIPKDTNHGDLALPCFILGKEAKKAPNLVANEIATKISLDGLISEAKALGPFLNLKLNSAKLAETLLPEILSGNFTANKNSNSKKMMIEYLQTNTHKAFHVGHIRCAALGDSLVRIFKWLGFEVIPVNYLGDEGTHVAKCIWYYKNHNKEPVPETNRSEFLGNLYSKANNLLEDLKNTNNVEFEKNSVEVSKVLQQLESKQGELYQLWLTTKEWSMQDFKVIYDWLNCQFEHYFFESEFGEESKKIVSDFLQKEIFKKDKGAIGVDLTDFKLGFWLLIKSDGTALYSARDLALANKKFSHYKIDYSLNVVDSGQKYHFDALYKCLEIMGFKQASANKHVDYAQVVRPDGKMGSRKGNVILFSELKDQLIRKIKNDYLNKYTGDWSNEEIETAAHKISLATMRYGMLNQDNNTQVVFDLDQWISKTGNTGPYLLYAYARICSILREAKQFNTKQADYSLVTAEQEKQLLLHLANFRNSIEVAGKTYSAHSICVYLYELSKLFSKFYKDCRVINENNADLTTARLELVRATGLVLNKGLELLGIKPLERM